MLIPLIGQKAETFMKNINFVVYKSLEIQSTHKTTSEKGYTLNMNFILLLLIRLSCKKVIMTIFVQFHGKQSYLKIKIDEKDVFIAIDVEVRILLYGGVFCEMLNSVVYWNQISSLILPKTLR